MRDKSRRYKMVSVNIYDESGKQNLEDCEYPCQNAAFCMDDAMKERLKDWGVQLTAQQTRRLELFGAELLEKNSRFNLVSAGDACRLWSRHILDSLAAVPLLRRLLTPGGIIADAGSGAGLPGIPLAITLENFSFHFWDSNLKRQMFLTWAISRLALKNARAHRRRIGRNGHPETGKYDAVTERAMGKLEDILPQCLNMLKEGGIFLAWQSFPPAAGAEETFAYRLPDETKDRFIGVFRKPDLKAPNPGLRTNLNLKSC